MYVETVGGRVLLGYRRLNVEDYTIHKQERKNKNDQQLLALHVTLKPEWAAGTE